MLGSSQEENRKRIFSDYHLKDIDEWKDENLQMNWVRRFQTHSTENSDLCSGDSQPPRLCVLCRHTRSYMSYKCELYAL